MTNLLDNHDNQDKNAIKMLSILSEKSGIPLPGAKIRRSSSRFCLGVEHGDYNGTELFGVGTDRFIWMAYKPNSSGRIRIFSGNFPEDGVVDFVLGNIPAPRSPEITDTWARFAFGVNHVLERDGFKLQTGIDAVLYGNIPGGGMSRSASLTLNLILSLLEVNRIEVKDKFKIVDMAQAVETDYIGSPCGKLDQIMILFAREGLGTHYDPKNREVRYVPLGGGTDFRLASLDTGTVRPGLEKSTYRIRRAECEKLVSILQENYDIEHLADIRDKETYDRIFSDYSGKYPDLCARLKYIFFSQQRFYEMLDAWKEGDIIRVGALFRTDGFSLRDDYNISGPELEAMCDIARTVDGVYGERMLGGGDKGASGAICRSDAISNLKKAVDSKFPRSFPGLADKYAVHSLKLVDGITTL